MNEFKENELVLITKGSIVDQVSSVLCSNNKTTYRLNDNKGLFLENELQIPSNDQLAYKLKTVVENWVDRTFNFIQVDVYEKCLDNMLYEHIELNSDDDIEEQLEPLIERQEEIEDQEEISEEDQKELDDIYGEISELENERDTLNDDNYPMWNTLYEIKDSWNRIKEEGVKVGLGLINENDYFKDTLFATSCGHSFYSGYWIPLYLGLFGDTIAKKYKNVNYEGM